MATEAEVLGRARSQLGVAEDPPGSNRVAYSAWYGVVGPWCAMFVSWVFYHEGLALPASTAKGFAYTPSGAAWFRKLGRWSTTPTVGAVVFYDFPGDGVNRISHVGIVEEIRRDGSIVAIEGNTDEAGGRTGGKVMRRARRVGIVGYGLPAYTAEPAPPPSPTRPDSEVTGMQLRKYFFTMPTLGGDGRGWMGPQNGLVVDGAPIPFAEVVSVEPNGPYPPRDGHWPIPALAPHDEGGALVVSSAGTPNWAPGFWVQVLEA